MKEIIVFVSVVFEGYVKLLIGRFVAQVLRGECLFFAKLVRFGEFFGGSFPM